MKVGIRKSSIKKSISARTTGKAKRKLKKIANPLYGKKGMGWIKNPKRAFKNKIYKKTTISAKSVGGLIGSFFYYMFYLCFLMIYGCLILMWWMLKGMICLGIWLVNAIITLVGKISGQEVEEATSTEEILTSEIETNEIQN